MIIKFSKRGWIICSIVLLFFLNAETLSAVLQSRQYFPAESLANRLERLNKLGSETGKMLSYNATILKDEEAPAFTPDTNNMEEWLTKSLAHSGFTFEKKSETHYVVLRNKKQVITSQSKPIKGIVLDVAGEPLAGVTIRTKDGKTGTVTGLDGDFSLEVSQNSRLVFSYIGYSEQEIPVTDERNIRVILKEDEQQLQEIVVVGYGTTKKINLVGAVDQIDAKQITERSNSNISRSLQGLVPGLNITFSDGKPSRNPAINLRGTGSIGAGGSALILIDGVEGDLNSVNPSDVESVSVLKDASSSAIYGARGAFGVILVTTKKASGGRTKVNYNGSVSRLQRTVKTEDGIISNGLQWTDGWYYSYMEGKDQGTPPGGINNVFKYSTDWYNELVKRDGDSSLDKVRVNSSGEYEYFGNTNWLDIIYNDHSYSTEHNISVSGGGEKAKYYVSGRYFSQDGIYSAGDEKYTQYNMRSKGEIQINKDLKLENNTDFTRFRSHQPMVMYDRQNIARQIQHQGYPMTMEKNPDGTWTEAAVYLGWAGFVEGTSWQKDEKLDLRNTTSLTYTPITDQLTFKGDFTYYGSKASRSRAENQYDYYTGPEIKKTRNTFSSLENIDYDTEYISSNITGNLVPKFSNKDHYLNVLLGWNLEHKNYKTITTYRRGLIYPSKPSFALMDGDYYTENQSGYEWAYAGFLYRANYIYKNRYLAEVSGRYDGSSKFPTNQQWGFFPSASLGWRVSEEGFMSSTRNWLDNLKFRFSVGSLGNGNVDPYLYLSTVPISKTSVILDGSVQTYASTPGLIPNSLTWEKATTYDVGMDMDLFRNRLSMVFDYYQRYTTDMYTVGPTLPAVLGSVTPEGNNAEMKTKGWELSLQWRDNLTLAEKPFNYSIKAMLWDSRTWVTKFNNPTKSLSNYYEGQEIGTIWGYHIEGLFKDQAEIDAHADQSKIRVSDSNILKPGDLKFGDLNKDGKIDNGQNTLDDRGDLKVVGNTSPRYQFGVNLAANWNGFGISAFVQGVGRKHWYPHRESAYFWGLYDRPYGYMLKEHVGDDVWTEENQNVNAYWPRLRGYLAQGSTRAMGTQANDRYLQNVAYVRLKNLQIDYSFNKNICEVLKVQDLKLYVSGENMFTWSPLYKHTSMFDPEGINPGDQDFRSTADSDGDGYGYPVLGSYTIGINVTF